MLLHLLHVYYLSYCFFFLQHKKYLLYFKSSVRKHIEKLHSFSPRVLRTSTFLKLYFHNNKVNSLIWTSKCSIWYSRFHFFCSPGLMLSTVVTKYWEVSSNYQVAENVAHDLIKFTCWWPTGKKTICSHITLSW